MLTQIKHAPVQVFSGERSATNPKKRGGLTLMDIFSAIDPATSETKMFRFRDENGNTITPKLPFPLLQSHPYFKENLAAFHAYKALYRPQMVIYDPEEAQDEELDRDQQELDARNRIAKLRDENDTDQLINILRRIEGPVSDVTLDTLVLKLNRIAKAEPEKILSIEEDADFGLKVIIDKAVEGGRLRLQDGRFYKLPNEDRLIADGLSQMVLLLKNDSGTKAYLMDAPIPAQVLSAEVKAPAGRGKRGKTTDWIKEGETITTVTVQSDGSTTLSDEKKYSDAQIENLVLIAIDKELYAKDNTGMYTLVGDKKVATPEEAVVFFKLNQDAAKGLENELRGYGMM